jgi:hypothetical protein
MYWQWSFHMKKRGRVRGREGAMRMEAGKNSEDGGNHELGSAGSLQKPKKLEKNSPPEPPKGMLSHQHFDF